MMLQCVYQQPNPFERFVYDSLVRKKSLFECEFVLCYHTLLPKVWIVADLYSQVDPPLLSTHVLRKNSSRNEKFIADIMQQVDPSTSHYKYVLNNCHIKRTGIARQRHSIQSKLRELKIWQELGSPLRSCDKEWIDNTIALDYSKAQNEKKVYVGFTPYVYNEITKRQEQLAATTFSHAVYDSSEFLAVNPSFGSISGGSKHVLKLENCCKSIKSRKVRLRLTDEENIWQLEIIGHLENEAIHFIAPAYTGTWNYKDGNRLIDIQILDKMESCPKANIKFAYL